MAESSSISSSDPIAKSPGFPWAFLIAIGIFLVVEIYLHTRDPHTLIAYPELAAADDQSVTYKAAREYVVLDGPAEIALVGSSQMREGVAMPYLIDQLKSRGIDSTISNYAVRGARVDVMESVAQLIASQAKPPKLVVIGMSVRDLRGEAPDYQRMALFWNWQRYQHELRSGDFAAKLRAMPIVVRNAIGEASYTLRYRDQLAMTLAKPLERFGVIYRNDLNPILGELSFQLQGNRGLKRLDEALKNQKVSLRKILANARNNYSWKLPIKTEESMVERLKLMIEQLKSGGSSVLIVEMPVAAAWKAELATSGMAGEFDRTLQEVATANQIRFIPVEKQPIQYTDDLFSDLQHHNRPGAEQFSRWLAGEIADIMKQSGTTQP